jgi:hypothetical protein
MQFQKPKVIYHPGGNIATLTLADGRKISLTDAENGQLAEQSGIKISKTADGQLGIYSIIQFRKLFSIAFRITPLKHLLAGNIR